MSVSISSCLTTFTFPSAVQLLLRKHRERFIKGTDAKVIAITLKQENVIPERIATKILNAPSTKDSNGVLYDHLYSQASEDDLKRLFKLCSEEEAYPRMNAFGKDMLEELEQIGKLALTLTLLKVTVALYNYPWLLLLLLLQVVLLLAGDEVTVTLPVLLFIALLKVVTLKVLCFQ